MPGVEVIAVVACVAAIVSAYSDGASMFTAIRKKYHERQSTWELERSLARGRTEIQTRFDLHNQELGYRYEYRPPHTSEIEYLSSGYPTSPASYSQGQILPEDVYASPTDTLGTSTEYGTSSPKPRRRSSGFGSVVSSIGHLFHPHPGRRRTPSFPSSAPQPAYIPQTRGYTIMSPSISEPIPEFDVRPATPSIPKSRPTSIPHDVLGGNPWKHESFIDSDDEDAIRHTPIKAGNHHLSPIAAPMQPGNDSLSAPSTASTDSTPSNRSTRSSTDRPTQESRPLWPPSERNNYLGFCKGAWKVQTGFRGFKIYSEPGTGYFTQQSWLRCTKCAFEAPMSPKSSSHNPLFEESVRTHKASGIKYRFEFLAKSHVPCKRDPTLHFISNAPRGTFCCVFCCAMAQGSTQVYGNLDIFMAHLVKHHWAVEREGLAVLPSMRCVVGRIASDSEYFDVNILPPRG
ncbi:hypothetical protein N7527_010184 [Penicillium freii]|nr:hypothetical protein N7527_010184 [Penicillium freii]